MVSTIADLHIRVKTLYRNSNRNLPGNTELPMVAYLRTGRDIRNKIFKCLLHMDEHDVAVYPINFIENR